MIEIKVAYFLVFVLKEFSLHDAFYKFLVVGSFDILTREHIFI